jgi:hypothetical protein
MFLEQQLRCRIRAVLRASYHTWTDPTISVYRRPGDVAPGSTGPRIAASFAMVLTITIFGRLLSAALKLLQGNDNSS